MAQNTVTHFRAQIQSLTSFFQPFHHPKALLIVVKASHDIAQSRLTCVSKWRMPQIVTLRDCFGQIFVEAQCSGNGAGNLADLDGVGESRAVMVTHRIEKYLCLVHQPAV